MDCFSEDDTSLLIPEKLGKIQVDQAKKASLDEGKFQEGPGTENIKNAMANSDSSGMAKVGCSIFQTPTNRRKKLFSYRQLSA